METIKIGAIVNTHGLKGDLKVKSFSEFNDIRFQSGNVVYIEYHGQMIEMEIDSFKEHKGMVLVSFKGQKDINLVEKYKGCTLYIKKEDLHDLEEDEVYYFDLMDCQVFDEDNHLLGKVEDIIETGANAVLRVNKKILIPYVNDFIVDVDIENKKIIVHVMKGLL